MSESRAGYYARIVEGIKVLPSLPAIVSQLVEVVNSSDSSAGDAARLIEKDPAMTSKMLRLANSAFYGIPRSISSISSAVVILGFNTIRTVALSASVMKIFSGTGAGSGFDPEGFWRHSIVCAMIAKQIAQYNFGSLGIDPESAFCAGIMHDIGKLIFMQFLPQDYNQVLAGAPDAPEAVIELERRILGMTHAQIGSILADKWALPLELENSLVFHHDPDRVEHGRELVTVVHLADALCHDLQVLTLQGEKRPAIWSGALPLLGISDEEFTGYAEMARGIVDKSGDFLSIMRQS